MDRYYRPEIEEFHVGFECEYSDKVDSWISHTVKEGEGLRLGDKRKYRVKYLDQEDIESLGFKLRSEDEYYSKDKTYNIYTGNKNIEIYSEGVCFIGIIKNKSELKRILKQIGYEK